MSSRSEALKARLAERAAEIFNTRHRLGSRVMYIQRAGAVPIMTTTTGTAFVQAARSVVYVAHRAEPVETDSLYAPPFEVNPAADYVAARGRFLRAVLVFAAGFATAVAVALLMPPAKAVAPEHIVIDCVEPGDAPVDAEIESGRAQA